MNKTECRIFRTMKLLISLTVFGLLVGCSSTTGSGSVASSSPGSSDSSSYATKIDMTSLKDWTGQGSIGVYVCNKKPSCPDLRFAFYQTNYSSSTDLKLLSNLNENPKQTAILFKAAFAISGSNRNSTLEPDGDPQKIVLKNALEGIGMHLKGTKADGSQRDPGYMIMMPGKRKVHIFMGISQSKELAKLSAMSLANAWRPF